MRTKSGDPASASQLIAIAPAPSLASHDIITQYCIRATAPALMDRPKAAFAQACVSSSCGDAQQGVCLLDVRCTQAIDTHESFPPPAHFRKPSAGVHV